VNELFAVLGDDYSGPIHEEVLFENRLEQHPTALKALMGKRLVGASETGDGWRMNESRLKRITGSNKIVARGMYENFSTFVPSHKLLIETNHKPQIRGTDRAVWRRLVLVPFETVFWNPDKAESGPEHLRQDKQLPKKFAAERSGILAWMVRGCMEWQRDGLRAPEIVTEATSEYQREQDVVGLFIRECCIDGDPKFEVSAATLFAAYTRWCEAAGERATNQRRFGQSLTERGYIRFTSNGTKYRGIGILARGCGPTEMP